MQLKFSSAGTCVFAAACLLISSLACAEPTVNFGVQPATQPIYIAKATGLIHKIEKKDHVHIVFQSFPDGAPENQAMGGGSIQIASAGMGPAIVAAARLPTKLLAVSILEQTAIIVPKNSPIHSVAQLKGKRIAYPGRGSQQYPILVKALNAAGLKIGDVTLFKTKGADVPILIKNHTVDAGITWDPHVSSALADGYARVLEKAEKIMPIKNGHYVGNGVYARTDFIKQHPVLVQDLMDAIVKSIVLINQHPNRAIKLWSQQIGFPAKTIRYSLEKKISVYDPDVAPDAKMIATYSGFLKRAGILQPSDNPKFDPSFAKKALANLSR